MSANPRRKVERMETIEEARSVANAAHKVWWDAYGKRKGHYGYEAVPHPTIQNMKKQVFIYDDPAEGERIEALHLEASRLRFEAVQRFGKPGVGGCEYCKEVSVFGGPGHSGSPNCRSGRHPHCTCDTCF